MASSPRFSVYHLGPSLEGLILNDGTRHHVATDPQFPELARQDNVTYLYGDCPATTAAGADVEGGCVPPIEVQSSPLCEKHKNLYQDPATGGWPFEALTIKGVPAAAFDQGRILEIYTLDTTITIYGKDPAQVLRVADLLRLALPIDIPTLTAPLTRCRLPPAWDPPFPSSHRPIEQCSPGQNPASRDSRTIMSGRRLLISITAAPRRRQDRVDSRRRTVSNLLRRSLPSAAAFGMLAILGCSDETPGRQVIAPAEEAALDLRRGTFDGVGIGSTLEGVRTRLGNSRVSPDEALAPIDRQPLVVGAPPAPQNPSDAVPEEVWRFKEAAMVADGGRVWLALFTAKHAVTSGGAGTGSSLASIKKAFPQSSCDTANRTTEYVQFEFCTVEIAPERHVYFAYDPVRSITISRAPLACPAQRCKG